ncbi:putative glycoside hydrolase [Thermoclostridium stercorarium]|uniref:putative glycoside hydrolase n=1 Tax=Thermoclostridium stercorarium TaxID=1510 RepID=UPI000B0DBEF3|nr:putative glycoside hydrolase [Thermoclostridium stercorarium]
MENKKQMINVETGKQKKKTVSIVVLTVLVLLSLSLLALYIRHSSSDSRDGNGADRSGALNTITPTVTPEPTGAPYPTEIPAEEPSVTPEPSPTATPAPKPEFQPVRALYLKPESFQNPTTLDHYIDLANRTEINAYVIDIKSDWGTITYRSEIEDVRAAKACRDDIDIREIIKKFHDNNIRVIGRVVTFKDSVITKYKPELAIHHDGKLFDQSGKRQRRLLA